MTPAGTEIMARPRWLLLGLAVLCFLAAPADAYTAAGDRIFPATLLLPQIAPSDDVYFTTSTLPLKSAAVPWASDQTTNFSFTYDKTLTERVGIGVTVGYNDIAQASGGTATGWQNVSTFAQYLLVLDQAQELELSVGVERDWGDTGARKAGADVKGATTSWLYIGKGLGSAAPEWLRPVALTGVFGFQASDGGRRPDLLSFGGTVEYSIPYLESKVANVALPDWMRQMTPIVELQFSAPAGDSQGWEFGLEAQRPATRAAGSGIGVIAQLHVALDFFAPESLGRPLFGAIAPN
jgi:hypothetical protein